MLRGSGLSLPRSSILLAGDSFSTRNSRYGPAVWPQVSALGVGLTYFFQESVSIFPVGRRRRYAPARSRRSGSPNGSDQKLKPDSFLAGPDQSSAFLAL